MLRQQAAVINMPSLPLEILRLILASLAGREDSPHEEFVNSTAGQDRCSRSASLLACCLVNKAFMAEAQALLYQSLTIKTEETSLRWAQAARSHGHLAKYVQTLYLACTQAENGIGTIMEAATNLRCLTLDTADVERKECLSESINTSLRRCQKIESITLIAITSIKTVSIVYNLPYRLQVLALTGLYNYKGGLWDSSDDWIDAENFILSGAKMLDSWDMYFLFQLFAIAPARPPSKLQFNRCQVSFDFLPAKIYKAVNEISIREAPQLLELGELEKFSELSSLSFGTKHDFVKLCRPLPTIRRLHLNSCNERTRKVLTGWLRQGYIPSLDVMSMARDDREESASSIAWLAELSSLYPAIAVRFSLYS